ncbi:MAG: Fumarylacetoacetate hydrolase family protein [Caulobacter sp.]|nr:Fumarylacetoacetate hydrolase family protein [Caulobacter sp.]
MRGMLPDDHLQARLIGRMMTPEGPSPVAVVEGRLRDLSGVAPTVSDLIAGLAPGQAPPAGRDLGPIADHEFRPVWGGGDADGQLLAPIDLQCVKAAGVTFAVSALERVIEERARGDASRANAVRDGLQQRIGADLKSVVPGSSAAEALKAVLLADGLWSQYLEVAIGPHAEVFTKAPVLSSVGWGQQVGVRADSVWNNPEPEIVMVCDAEGRARGATLGNDVNLRDIEGASALLLGKAKDNNASCALGPFIRLFDDAFTLDDVRQAVVTLEIEGVDNYRLNGSSSMSLISRDPLDLIGQTIGANHQYPDGFVLFLGTMFAPVDDRDTVGGGFTHKTGDIVRVASARLGTLENQVAACQDAPPWRFGLSSLMKNLAARDLIKA